MHFNMSPLIIFPVCLFKTHLFAPCSVPDTVLDSEVKERKKMLFLIKELSVRHKGQIGPFYCAAGSATTELGVRY